MAGAKLRAYCVSLFKPLEIPSVSFQYMLSLMNFIIKNQEKFPNKFICTQC